MSILKKIWKSNSKHKKLSEEWNALGSQLSLSPETPGPGSVMGTGASRQFLLKYAGVAPAERACSAPAMAAAVAQVIAQNKGSTKKLRRVTVTVSPKGISVEDATTSERILDVSIYRISYCSADAMHCTVFAFIAQGSGESLECHAFLCRKRKVARTVTLSAAQSFNTAYQVWQGNQDRKKMVESSVRNQKRKEELLPPTTPVGPKALLIDFSDDLSSTSPWVSFEEEGSSNLWEQAPAVPHHIISSDRLLAC